MNELEHSAKGTTWGKHKYIRIENGRYIYSETDKKGKTTSRDASIGEIRDRLKNFKLTKSSKSSSKSSSSSKKSSEKKEGSSKSGSAKEKTATEKTSGSTDEKKVETSSNEYQKETKSVDEHYAELLEKLRAKKNTSLLPQIRERQAMSERKKVKHMDDMYDGVILKPSMDDILEHHGILGMKWGKRNGPPYPLDARDHSASEKQAGYKKSIGGGRNESLYDRKTKKKAFG